MEFNETCAAVVDNMKTYYAGKWVNPMCAIGTKVNFSEGMKALKHLVSESIVERDELCGMPLYRYAPLPAFLETVE